MRTERFTPEQIIKAIRASGGFVVAAAKKLKCSPQAIYDYENKYPEIRNARKELTESYLDMAEIKLLEHIRKGNIVANIFYLKTKGKERGYIERQEQSHFVNTDNLPAITIERKKKEPDS